MIEKNQVKKLKITFFGNKIPWSVNYLRTFGEADIVTIKGDMYPKPHDCGITLCVFAGYCVNMEGGCYKIYDHINNDVYHSCDKILMKHIYFSVLRLEKHCFNQFDEVINSFITACIKKKYNKLFHLLIWVEYFCG